MTNAEHALGVNLSNTVMWKLRARGEDKLDIVNRDSKGNEGRYEPSTSIYSTVEIHRGLPPVDTTLLSVLASSGATGRPKHGETQAPDNTFCLNEMKGGAT
jgi:hypothetical protein